MPEGIFFRKILGPNRNSTQNTGPSKKCISEVLLFQMVDREIHFFYPKPGNERTAYYSYTVKSRTLSSHVALETSEEVSKVS